MTQMLFVHFLQGKSGSVEEAKRIFDQINEPNSVSFSAMSRRFSRIQKSENVSI